MVQHACLNVVPWIKPRLLSEEVQPFIFIFSGAWVNDANPIRAYLSFHWFTFVVYFECHSVFFFFLNFPFGFSHV